MEKWLKGWIVVGLIMLAVGVAHLIWGVPPQKDGAQAGTAAKSAFSAGTSLLRVVEDDDDPCERDGGVWRALSKPTEGHTVQSSICDYGSNEEFPLPYGNYSSDGSMIIQSSGYYKIIGR